MNNTKPLGRSFSLCGGPTGLKKNPTPCAELHLKKEASRQELFYSSYNYANTPTVS